MRDNKKELIGKLVSQIRYIALQGQTDTVWSEGRSDIYMYDFEKDIYWQTVEKFLLVYIESFEEDCYCYRLYRYSDKARYEQRTVLNQALESDEYVCLFSFEETKDYKKLLYLHECGIWYDDYEKAVYNFLDE